MSGAAMLALLQLPDGMVEQIIGRCGEGPGELEGAYRTLRLPDGRYAVYAQAIDEHNGYIYSVPWIEVPDDGSSRVAAFKKMRKGNIAVGKNIEELNLVRFLDPYLRSLKVNKR